MNLFDNIVITDIKSVVTVSSPKGRAAKITNRRWYGLSFCKEGQITYTHNGKEYISDHDHAVILPKGQSYNLYGNKKGVFPVINFECTNFSCDTVLSLPIRNTISYLNDYEQIKSLFLFKENRAKVISIFYGIIHTLSSNINSSDNILLPAIKYLENNYFNPTLSNSTLANQCKISEVYFRKLFIKEYSMTPKQYIIDIRITKAKQLLTDGILKINAVSEKCGFSNPYHFCRLFKEKTGVTPTEYMKQNRIYKI